MRFGLTILFCLLLLKASSQRLSRAEMDVKREFINFEDEEAHQLGLSFIKNDSNFYLGWAYLGGFLHERAADIKGYQKAIVPLLRAKYLLEKDYSKELKTRTSDYTVFYNNFYRLQDYNTLAFYLSNAYSIIDQPDSVMWIADEYGKFDFQKDVSYYNGPYVSKAWTVYRNRYILEKGYKFLYPTLAENVAYVNRLIDSALLRADRNSELNNQLLFDMGNDADYGPIYHIQSIVYAYEKKFKKAEEMYDKLEELGLFSYNNYALLKLSEGQFEEAYNFFDFNNKAVPYQKALEEWIYYQGVLNSYDHRNKESITKLINWIEAVGSTPGYGWYNIALARAYTNNGELEKAREALDKAKNFTEYHIGTTLGETSYRQASNFLSVLLDYYQMKSIKFEKRNWYFSFNRIYKFLRSRWRLMINRWTMLNEVAGFEDREKLLYDLFSGEGVSSWFEVFFIIRDFSVKYFEDYYTKLMKDPETPEGLMPYYQYALASLYHKEGKNGAAEEMLQKIRTSGKLALPYYRQLDFLVTDLEIDHDLVDEDSGIVRMYTLYPELLPYYGHRMSFNLKLSAENSELMEDCIDRMKDCNIRIRSDENPDYPTVTVTEIIKNNQNFASISIRHGSQKLLDNHTISISEPMDGVKMAYILFQIYHDEETKVDEEIY